MNVIEQKLVQKSTAIFNSFDKWSAFLELSSLQPHITKHWFTMATQKLRAHFTANPSDGWKWKEWGSPTDTLWFLEKFGSDSLTVGFGWNYQFHLHLGDGKRFDANLIDKLLQTKKYTKLLIPFGVNPRLNSGSGSRVMDAHFDFNFDSDNDGSIPQAELAWYAAHRTEEFARQAASKIEQFTRDGEMTRLLSELNAEAEKKA